MARYGDYSPHGPAPERWTPERFDRERGGRQSRVIERDHYEERDTYSNAGERRREISADDPHSRRPTRVGGDRYEDDRFYEREERYGPPARRGGGGGFRETRFHDEDEIDSLESSLARDGRRDSRLDDSPRVGGRGGRAPPRPGMLIRRQSSLDTFDRKPMPRYGPGRARSPPEVISMPGPRRRHSPKRFSSPKQYGRDYDDIGIAEPDRYGDENFRAWKEREVETIRRRRRENSPGYRREEYHEAEEITEEKPFPRRGRTKMSARLVNKRALFDIGYPFEDSYTAEGDFVIILKALNKELIDEVLERSKEYNDRDRDRVTYAIEAPLPPPDRGEIIERREIIIEKAPSEVPRSVRDWDVMSGAIGGSSHGGGKSEHGGHSHAGRNEHKSEHVSVHEAHHSHSRGRSPHGSNHSTIKGHKHHHSSSDDEKKQIVIERKPSKSKTRHHSRHRSRGNIKTEFIEEEEVGESNAMKTGPLALVLPSRSKSHHNNKDERRIKEEIRELELEKERIKRERKHDKKYHHHDSSDGEIIIERTKSHSHGKKKKRRDKKHHRSSSSSSSSSPSEGEVIIERKDSHGRREDVKIEKDRKESKILKGMLATLT